MFPALFEKRIHAPHVESTQERNLGSRIGRKRNGSHRWAHRWRPYDVPAGHTGEAKYGFRTIHMTGTQQYCKSNGTWSTPNFWSALNPVKNEVQVRLYDNPADSNK